MDHVFKSCALGSAVYEDMFEQRDKNMEVKRLYTVGHAVGVIHCVTGARTFFEDLGESTN
jgi:hypothetical protein